MMFVDGLGDEIRPVSPPAGVQAWIHKVHAPVWWRLGRTGRGVRVAIIDTGCDLEHPALRARIVESKSFVPGEPTAEDHHGHGTHVAGIIAQVAPEAELVVIKAFDRYGRGEETSLAQAVRWAHSMGAKVINASWGSRGEPADESGLHEAIRQFTDAGGVFVASAGNDGHRILERNTVCYPARWWEPVAVAATMQLVRDAEYGRVAWYSSAGQEIDVAAPGTGVISCAPGGGWVEMSGTSMAAPAVSGACALICEDWGIRHSEPPVNAPEPAVVELLRFLTRDIPPAGRDVLSGVGELDLAPLVETRRIRIRPGESAVQVQEGYTLREHQVALDVPARIETVDEQGGGRFLTEFRGTLQAAGAREIDWDPETQTGTGVIDVLPSGEPDEAKGGSASG